VAGHYRISTIIWGTHTYFLLRTVRWLAANFLYVALRGNLCPCQLHPSLLDVDPRGLGGRMKR